MRRLLACAALGCLLLAGCGPAADKAKPPPVAGDHDPPADKAAPPPAGDNAAPQPDAGARVPPDIKVGVAIQAWGSNGGALVGTWTVLEVRGNWALVTENPKDKGADRFWMNFDNVSQYRIVK